MIRNLLFIPLSNRVTLDTFCQENKDWLISYAFEVYNQFFV